MSAVPEWAISMVLVLSAIGVLVAHKPIHASLFFLLSLIALAAAYIDLSAGFIASMQILVYAGAILVIFVFVMVLFQDAYLRIGRYPPKSSPLLLGSAVGAFAIVTLLLADIILHRTPRIAPFPPDYGSVQALGKAMYVDFFFPFEAVVLLFLVAIVGSLYIAKRGK